MSNKKVLIDLGTVRISEYDSMNVTVERLEEVFNPIDKSTSMKWRFKGYSSTILNALKLINTRELLVEKKAVSDLNSYLKSVEDSNRKIYLAINKVQKSTKEVLEVMKT
ncbi:MAG TPA: hypothetical protein GX497_05550 [Bacillus bacterium]|nr:hypothetical protein [Bacillus sp. (in: firmicutes)]